MEIFTFQLKGGAHVQLKEAEMHNVVRVALHKNADLRIQDLPVEEFLQLLIRVGVLSAIRDDAEGIVFDIPAPSNLADKAYWAATSAEYFQSFGHNAVAAPEVK